MAIFIMSAATLADLWPPPLVRPGITVFTGVDRVRILPSSRSGFARVQDCRGHRQRDVAGARQRGLSDPSRRRAIGLWTAIASVGTAVGPTLGGVLVEHLGWRSIFLVNVPVGVLVVWLTLRYVAESRDVRPRSFDIGGQLLFMVTVGSLAEAVIEGPKMGWGSPFILTLFAVAVVGLCVFVWFERRSADPMMDLTLFRDREYALAIRNDLRRVLLGLWDAAADHAVSAERARLPARDDRAHHPAVFRAHHDRVAVHRASDRQVRRAPADPRPATLMLGLFGLILGGSGSVAAVLGGLALCGLGGALCLTPITTLAMTSVPAARAGMASGIMSAQRAIGSTVGFAVLGSVLAAWLVATLDPDLATAVPDPVERRAIASEIIASANPRAHVAEIGPRHPIAHANPKTHAEILVAAERDFVQGIRIALLVAIALLAMVFLVGLKWFPRGGGDAMLSDAERESAKLATSEP